HTVQPMTLQRRTYVLLLLAVIISGIATHAFRPEGDALPPCGIRDITLGDGGSAVWAQLHDQTLVDFALIASYVGLWGTMGLALNPGVAVIAVMAGIADIVENLAILHELALPDPVRFVRWVALAKWSLLGLVFITFVFLFRPDRVSGRC